MRCFLVYGLFVSLAACGGAAAPLPVDAADLRAPAPGEPAAPRSTPAVDVAAEERAEPPTEAASAASPPAVPPLPPRTVVLHVGDSFVHSGLTQRLREHLAALDVRYEVRAEHSTNSLDWAKRVPALVAATQPDLVIVTLGGNEIASKHLDVQGRAVDRIVQAIGDRPCVWTTPPLWKEQELGLFDTIQAHLGHCRFFETDREVGAFLPRRADGIHPTAEGGAKWADALFGYLGRERVGGERPWALAPRPEAERTPAGRRGPLPH